MTRAGPAHFGLDTNAMPQEQIIQSLWIGPQLSTMERLSIRSFQSHGHPFHLYAYDQIEHVPDGVTVKDANEVLPQSEVFVYTQGPRQGSPSAFVNRFRYKLLWDRGGWWCDLDVICLKRFDFAGPHVFAGEKRMKKPVFKVNCAVIKAPAGSKVMRRCYERATQVGQGVIWAQTGPHLLTRVVYGHWLPLRLLWPPALCRQLKGPRVFHPIHPWQAADVLKADRQWDLSGAHAVHLWHESWRQNGWEKDGTYPSSCLYEQFKARYLGSAGVADEPTASVPATECLAPDRSAS